MEVLTLLRRYLEGCDTAIGSLPRAASGSTDLNDNDSLVQISNLYDDDFMTANHNEIMCDYWLK